MVPRTKLQFRVLDLHSKLPDLRTKMLDWAVKKCIAHKGFATKNRVICMDCGFKFPTKLVYKNRATCVECGAKLEIVKTQKRTDSQVTVVCITATYEDFQVVRNFEIKCDYGAIPSSDKHARYGICEILQHFILADGKREVIAMRQINPYYANCWGGELELRDKRNKNNDVYPDFIHPESKFLNEFKRYGIDERLKYISPLGVMIEVPKFPKFETLLKCRQYELLGYLINNKHQVDKFWSSIKICIRNNYMINDAEMWVDYLDLLRFLGKDLRNAFYVCPKKLKQAHDNLVARKRLIQQRGDLDQQRKNAILAQTKFLADKSKFFGIEFTDGEIEIKVIESVDDFIKEGDLLHHCVFTNEYFERERSLILSARIGDKRLETIEIDLGEFKVVQCQGLFNQPTEYHDRILKLVKKNIKTIRSRLTA